MIPLSNNIIFLIYLERKTICIIDWEEAGQEGTSKPANVNPSLSGVPKMLYTP